jgi:hypothetical protein
VFVIGKPRNEAFTAYQLTPAEADGGNGRATLDPSGDDVAYMRFRAVQEFRNRRQRQKPKIIQPIHKNFFFLLPAQWRRLEPADFLPAPYQTSLFPTAHLPASRHGPDRKPKPHLNQSLKSTTLAANRIPATFPKRGDTDLPATSGKRILTHPDAKFSDPKAGILPEAGFWLFRGAGASLHRLHPGAQLAGLPVQIHFSAPAAPAATAFAGQ